MLTAQALPPTAILSSLKVENFTSPGTTSLVVAKPDRIEVWDVTKSGLESRADLEVWGSVVTIEKVEAEVSAHHACEWILINRVLIHTFSSCWAPRMPNYS